MAGWKKPRPYCTQKCLLGLVRGQPMDPSCPNAAVHRQHTNTDSQDHPIDNEALQRLLAEQLTRPPDDIQRMEPLWKEGARGVLFRCALLEYGYVFVAKGFEGRSAEWVEREVRVYERLRDLQGNDIPVFLGVVDMETEHTYFGDGYTRELRHMIFMSFGGEMVFDRGRQRAGLNQRMLPGQLFALLGDLHARGVVHRDVREPNVLWCEDTGRLMLIDFERSAVRVRDPSWTAELQECFERSVRKDFRGALDVWYLLEYGED
jgi:hypothetical protein